MSYELTGKKKIVVDQSAFRDLVRDSQTDQILNETSYRSNTYLQYSDSDSVRIGIGKYWDYKLLDNGEADFSNTHSPSEIFCNAPLNLEYCEEEPYIYQDEDEYSVQRHRLILSCAPTVNDIASNFKFVYPNDNTYTLLEQFGTHNYFWAYLMKYGIVTPDGQAYAPIINTNTNFLDHYHETFLPYTPQELTNQTPAGKAFYADYKTYYNSRSPSNIDKLAAKKNIVSSTENGLISYESFIATENL